VRDITLEADSSPRSHASVKERRHMIFRRRQGDG